VPRYFYWDKKTTVEEATQLSIFKLKEFGLLFGCTSTTLTWTHSPSGHKNSIGILVDTENLYAKVNYTITDRTTGKKTDYDYKISLTTTPCNFGGVRYWFICPLSINGVYCGRRVGTLYLPPRGNYFGCRHCYELSYNSRNENRSERFGKLWYMLKTEEQYEELFDSISRWTWRGRPTKKVRKLKALEHRIRAYEGISVEELLFKR